MYVYTLTVKLQRHELAKGEVLQGTVIEATSSTDQLESGEGGLTCQSEDLFPVTRSYGRPSQTLHQRQSQLHSKYIRMEMSRAKDKHGSVA